MRRFLILLILVLALVELSKMLRKLDAITVPDDYRSIAKAYRHLNDGGTITIKPGKYKIRGLVVDRNVTFCGSTGRAEDVIIDSPGFSAFRVTSGSPTFQDLTVISGGPGSSGVGFEVTGGTPKILRCTITSSMGMGIHIRGGRANPLIQSCAIKDCGGAGVEVVNHGRGTICDCEIYGNNAENLPYGLNCDAGIFVLESGNPTVTGCRIHDGKVGISVQRGLGEFKDCEIYGNSLKGIRVSWSANPAFSGCKIHDEKISGVVVEQEGLGTFKDCEIYGNHGAGIEVKTSGDPTFTDCKIHDGKQGGVFIHDGGKGTFNKNTLENNFTDGELNNWNIQNDAGEVKGSGNTPEIPER